ncbi:MAG TPA: PRC and DUF2382 domain-containing protein, partial [Catenuloplanes sp.]
MIAQEQLGSLQGTDVYDRNGDKIGSLGQVYLDTSTNQPAWASVNTGLFGLKESLVPISEAEQTGEGIRVPYDKAMVKDAPNVDVSADEPLMGDDVNRLYRHYQLGGGGFATSNYDTGGTSQAGYGAGAAHASAAGDADLRGDTGSRTAGGSGDDAMTRSEERLNVDTERQQVGTARLRKYVTTENVQTTVPVTREEVRLEREPITDANAGDALSGPAITESEHEVTLHAERPVVEKEAVPVERVRLGKESVTDQETVSGEVRKEQIDTDMPG